MQVRPQQPHPINGSSNKYICAPDAESLARVIREQYPEWKLCDGVSIVRGKHGETNQVACHIWKGKKEKVDKFNFSFGDDSSTESGGGVKKYRAKRKFKTADDER